jgi:hypothetical protein
MHATTPSRRKLTLDDIADLRAYERERPEFRAKVIEIKRRRRIELGTFVTLMFENRDTMRLQIQEMARVEKILTDEGIQEELEAYNPLIPEPGQLCATLFIELTSDEAMREWLPKLVNVERSVVVRLADGSEVRGELDKGHESQLTRTEVTAAVHYMTFEFSPQQIETFEQGPVVVAIDHPAYREDIELMQTTVDELLRDLRPDPE